MDDQQELAELRQLPAAQRIAVLEERIKGANRLMEVFSHDRTCGTPRLQAMDRRDALSKMLQETLQT